MIKSRKRPASSTLDSFVIKKNDVVVEEQSELKNSNYRNSSNE